MMTRSIRIWLLCTAALLPLAGPAALHAQDAATEDSLNWVKVDTITPSAGSAFTVEKAAGVDRRYVPLIKRLEHDGWPADWVAAHFADKRTVFIPKMTIVKPRTKTVSDKSAYLWVNTSESAEACKAFMAKYDKILSDAQARYGVDRETITALLRCETRHGTVTGNYHVFSVYASMALMDHPTFLKQSIGRAKETLKDRKASDSEIRTEVEWIRGRATSRSRWAYRELENLLKIDRQGLTDALGIYGSWAGAFGWAQFLPSSYLLRAVDGDGDRKIDLFNPSDAIHSVANYLSKAGYKIGDDASRRRAIHNYNNSTAYVESIMGLAARVKASMPETAAQ
ncbi:MAG: lytic murein transglycosylase [Bacteroidetes bacterium]|nr:lytic murein transglycosylase [Bacteroidota bacterium]